MKKLGIWMNLVRAKYLVLAIILASIGTTLAFLYKPGGYVIPLSDIVLVYIGVIFAHASINLLNEYSDYEAGVEEIPIRSPFTGGKNYITSGAVKPYAVLIVSLSFLLLALLIGTYFTVTSHIGILILMLIGAISILSYTDYLTRFLANELISGFVLGTVVILGTYLALIHVPYVPLLAAIPLEVFLISLIPGLLTALLLIIVRFPVTEKENQSGRRSLSAFLGKKKAAALYSIGAAITFLLVVLLPVMHVSSYWIYLALLPLPYILANIFMRLKTIHNAEELIGALRSNVIVILITNILIFLAVMLQVLLN